MLHSRGATVLVEFAPEINVGTATFMTAATKGAGGRHVRERQDVPRQLVAVVLARRTGTAPLALPTRSPLSFAAAAAHASRAGSKSASASTTPRHTPAHTLPPPPNVPAAATTTTTTAAAHVQELSAAATAAAAAGGRRKSTVHPLMAAQVEAAQLAAPLDVDGAAAFAHHITSVGTGTASKKKFNVAIPEEPSATVRAGGGLAAMPPATAVAAREFTARFGIQVCVCVCVRHL